MALPWPLLVDVLKRVQDKLAPEAQGTALGRLVRLAFSPEEPGAQQLIGLYASFRKHAAAEDRRTVAARLRQSAEAEAPEVRRAATHALAAYLPDLEGQDRDESFDVLLAALDDPREVVNEAARWSVEMIGPDLTSKEQETVRRRLRQKPRR